jgi:hypothetical protein
MALGDLGRPTCGLSEPGYGLMDNRAVQAAQNIAYDSADKACPPCQGLTQAAFDEQWRAAFDFAMRELGWEYTGDHCMCDDPEYGHEPACGWSRREGA